MIFINIMYLLSIIFIPPGKDRWDPVATPIRLGWAHGPVEPPNLGVGDRIPIEHLLQ